MDHMTKSFFQASGVADAPATTRVGAGVSEMIGTRWK